MVEELEAFLVGKTLLRRLPTLAEGAKVVQQSVKAGLLDELQIHLAPVLLGDGVRLFERMGPEDVELEGTRVIDSPRVTHLGFRVVK